MKIKNICWLPSVAIFAGLISAPSICLAQTKGTVVEQIVSRVNNQIITMSDYEKASAGLAQEVKQDCQNCPPEQIQSQLKERQKNLLRDMIDQQLLIARAKDMDLNVETDLVKRLDEVRKQNSLSTVDDLEKAVEVGEDLACGDAGLDESARAERVWANELQHPLAYEDQSDINTNERDSAGCPAVCE